MSGQVKGTNLNRVNVYHRRFLQVYHLHILHMNQEDADIDFRTIPNMLFQYQLSRSYNHALPA